MSYKSRFPDRQEKRKTYRVRKKKKCRDDEREIEKIHKGRNKITKRDMSTDRQQNRKTESPERKSIIIQILQMINQENKL